MKIHKCNQHCITGNPLLSPPPGGGAYLFQAHVRGGLIKTGGLRPINYIKWISSSTLKVGVHAAKDQKQFQTSSW